MSFYEYTESTKKPKYLVIKQSIITLLNEEIKVIEYRSTVEKVLDLKPSQVNELITAGYVDVDHYRYLITILGYE